MFSNKARIHPPATTFPTEVHSLVSELSHADHHAAEMQIWRDLQRCEGAVWHRQSDAMLLGISERLAEVSDKLRHTQNTYAIATSEDALNGAIQKTVRGSQLATEDLLLPNQVTYLEEQYRSMYKFLSLITGDPTVVIDLRIERDGAYIENFHRDFGTALLMTLRGPGTHFIKPDNQPCEHDEAFFRANLLRPDEVFEVPTCSLLAMRGKPSDGEESSAQGLWHSSPAKIWNNTKQWDLRVLLIATSPTSQILPATPNLAP